MSGVMIVVSIVSIIIIGCCLLWWLIDTNNRLAEIDRKLGRMQREDANPACNSNRWLAQTQEEIEEATRKAG